MLASSFSHYLIQYRGIVRGSQGDFVIWEKTVIISAFQKRCTLPPKITSVFFLLILSFLPPLPTSPSSQRRPMKVLEVGGSPVCACVSFPQRTTSLGIYLPLKFYQVLYNLFIEYFITP